MKGKMGIVWQWVWNMMDKKTRIQLATMVTNTREIQDAKSLFKQSTTVTTKKPKIVVTDGLQSYKKAVKKEFNTNMHETERLWNVGLQHHPNNNHVERLHGTIRQREKTMRGLKIEDTPIVDGNRIYYNFIKPHEALGGKTPSEKAGIEIEGDNKWLTLMKKSIQYQKAKSIQ